MPANFILAQHLDWTLQRCFVSYHKIFQVGFHWLCNATQWLLDTNKSRYSSHRVTMSNDFEYMIMCAMSMRCASNTMSRLSMKNGSRTQCQVWFEQGLPTILIEALNLRHTLTFVYISQLELFSTRRAYRVITYNFVQACLDASL